MSREGQTMVAFLKGRPTAIQCIKDTGWVHWQSLDLQYVGDMSPDRWDRLQAVQREARRNECEELPEAQA